MGAGRIRVFVLGSWRAWPTIGLTGAAAIQVTRGRVETIRVLIAENNLAYGQSLSQMLREEEGIEVLAAVGSGQAAVEAVARHRPDAILMDIDMPAQSGLRAARTIRERWPAVRVIILTLHSGEAFRRWAREMGATAFLPKDADPEEIVRAVRGLGPA